MTLVPAHVAGVELGQAARGGLVDLELGARDHGGQPVRSVHGDPRVLGAPHHQHREVDLAVAGLDLVGEGLVGFGDLAVEGRLAFRSTPGLNQLVKLSRGQPHVAGTGDVGADKVYLSNLGFQGVDARYGRIVELF
jgi:hypothetical protein